MGRKFYKITREGCKVREVYITESAVTHCNVGSTNFNSKETGGGGGEHATTFKRCLDENYSKSDTLTNSYMCYTSQSLNLYFISTEWEERLRDCIPREL